MEIEEEKGGRRGVEYLAEPGKIGFSFFLHPNFLNYYLHFLSVDFHLLNPLLPLEKQVF